MGYLQPKDRKDSENVLGKFGDSVARHVEVSTLQRDDTLSMDIHSSEIFNHEYLLSSPTRTKAVRTFIT